MYDSPMRYLRSGGGRGGGESEDTKEMDGGGGREEGSQNRFILISELQLSRQIIQRLFLLLAQKANITELVR